MTADPCETKRPPPVVERARNERDDHLTRSLSERGTSETKRPERGCVVVLAQASMASAAEAVSVEVPVLTSPRLGVQRLAESLATR